VHDGFSPGGLPQPFTGLTVAYPENGSIATTAKETIVIRAIIVFFILLFYLMVLFLRREDINLFSSFENVVNRIKEGMLNSPKELHLLKQSTSQ
jgi:hypothetical protein